MASVFLRVLKLEHPIRLSFLIKTRSLIGITIGQLCGLFIFELAASVSLVVV